MKQRQKSAACVAAVVTAIGIGACSIGRDFDRFQGGLVPEADAAVDVTDGAATPKRLFRSGFEGDVRLESPSSCAVGNCQQAIVGGASAETSAWPIALRGGSGWMQLLAGPGTAGVTESTIGNYIVNEIVRVPGYDGNPTSALHQVIKKRSAEGTLGGYRVAPGAEGTTARSQGDLYITHRLKLLPDVATGLPASEWRQCFELYQGTGARISLLLLTDADRKPRWELKGTYPGASGRDWSHLSPEKPPTTWLKLELFWHPSSAADGHVWAAIDGERLLEHRGPNLAGEGPVLAIQLFLITPTGALPTEQWVDDLEIWDGPPSNAAPTP